MKDIIKGRIIKLEEEKDKRPEYISAFIGIIIGLSLGLVASIFMYKDAESCHELLEENRILKELLYNN